MTSICSLLVLCCQTYNIIFFVILNSSVCSHTYSITVVARVLTSDRIILHGNNAIHGLTSLTLNVCQGLVKRETFIDFAAKQKNYSLLNKLRNLQRPNLLQDGNSWMVKRANPLLNTFCSN